MPDNSILIVGSTPPVSTPATANYTVTLVRVNADGTTSVPSIPSLGHGASIPSDAAIDQAGNIWIVGTTDADDFPLVNPLISQKVPSRQSGFVVKLDPKGSKILYSTFLGGHQPSIANRPPFPILGSFATHIALDSTGSAYILGHTSEADFPAMHDASYGPPDEFTFVMKISGDGSRLVFGKLIGGSGPSCTGSSGCLTPAVHYNIGTAIAVDSSGTATIAGITNSSEFPTTQGAFQGTCRCSALDSDGFVARVSADGARLVWSTYFGGTQLGIPGYSADALALDRSGNVYVAGIVYSDFPTTPGVVQHTVQALPTNPPTQVVAAKLSSDGSSLVYATYLGGSRGSKLSGLVLDPAGNVWVAGSTTSPDFPSLPDVAPFGTDFVVELNAGATRMAQQYRLPAGTVTQTPIFDAAGNIVLLSSQGTLLRLSPINGLTGPGVLEVANAASYAPLSGISASELITLFGVGLGPEMGVVAAPDANGAFPTQLAGVQVFVDSKPAPLLFVGPNQVNLQVPSNLSAYTVQVVTPKVALNPLRMTQSTSIGIFRSGTSAFGAALNQDGSVNSAENPAQAGSIVSLFAIGFPGKSGMPDGTVWTGADGYLTQMLNQLPITAPILYAGAAPGLINGIIQMNIQLPANVTDPVFTIGEAGKSTSVSNTVQIHAQ
ncbi:MAG: hypothetical protein JWO80_2607 [Bryobacterales bacterium]|nr:hypothetical protein [Bryobacterales bacterium]